MQNAELNITEFEALCPEFNRRSLQRDLKAMMDKQRISAEGAINKLVYRLKDWFWELNLLQSREKLVIDSRYSLQNGRA